MALPPLFVDKTLGSEDAEGTVIPCIGEALRRKVASEVRSVCVCKPGTGRERRRLPGGSGEAWSALGKTERFRLGSEPQFIRPAFCSCQWILLGECGGALKQE